MVFSSLLFLFVFLPITFAGYYLLPRKARNVFLLAANLVFYFCGEPVYIVVMLGSILINYVFGLLIGRENNTPKAKKAYLCAALCADIAVLCVFKYTGFIAGILSKVPAFSALRTISIPLPVGISFYTFQTMSYIIDVYRGDAERQKNPIAFANYVSLFPQLIAGPIVRYRDVDEQLSFRQESFEKVSSGAALFACGLAKKVLIANAMGALWDKLSALAGFGGILGALGAAVAFSFQIYFDFSGYSDMARGLGRMFGFEFLENFNYPYISKSVTEFWRRWHISLGTWFREYVYIPLGGNRRGIRRQALNLLIVWALTGLWHGASWNFVLWGLYYGALLMLEKFFMKSVAAGQRPIIGRIYTLIAVVFGWVIFAFDSMDGLKGYFSAFSGDYGFLSGNARALLFAYLPLMLVAGFASTPCAHRLFEKVGEGKLRTALTCIFIVLSLLLSTAQLVYGSFNPFLYFRF